MAGLGKWLAPKASWAQTAGTITGVAGGLLQAGVGGYRIYLGVRDKVKPRIILGGLDVAAGACWAASACAIATPWTLAGFVGFTVARMGYNYREPLKEAARKLFGRIRGKPVVPKHVAKKKEAEAKPPEVIVTEATTPAVANRAAREPGVTTVRTRDGNRAVVTPATVETQDGRQHETIVVTPVAE